jgi:ribosomal protein L34
LIVTNGNVMQAAREFSAIHMGGPRAFFDRRQNEYGFPVRKSTGLTRPVVHARRRERRKK